MLRHAAALPAERRAAPPPPPPPELLAALRAAADGLAGGGGGRAAHAAAVFRPGVAPPSVSLAEQARRPRRRPARVCRVSRAASCDPESVGMVASSAAHDCIEASAVSTLRGVSAPCLQPMRGKRRRAARSMRCVPRCHGGCTQADAVLVCRFGCARLMHAPKRFPRTCADAACGPAGGARAARRARGRRGSRGGARRARGGRGGRRARGRRGGHRARARLGRLEG